MRERFIAILVGLTLAVLVLYGVPRAYFIANFVEDQQTEEISRAGQFTVSRIESRIESDREVDAELLTSALDVTDGASYRSAEGTVMTVGAFNDDPKRSIVKRYSVAGGELVVTRDRAIVDEEVDDALLPLVLLGVGLAGAAAVVAWFIAGRATSVFRQLADAATDLGRGSFELDLPTRGLPEAVAIASALEGAAAQIDQLVRREREFAVNASHQLRTPITALRLELEDLTYWEETPVVIADQIRASISELDRLSAAIDDLLDLARREHRGERTEVDLNVFVGEVVERWQRQLAAEGRALVVTSKQPMPAQIAVGPAAQVLDVLIDNARVRGVGAVTVTTRDENTHVAVRVADEGVRRVGNEVFRRGVSSRIGDGGGNGVGLAVAADLAEASGGHLSIDENAPSTTFVLLLPRVAQS